ncbi:hypothetical protein B6S44_06920 [Bosea sp. Tri-44]|uniref:hypothetical protein n=1 Tax=Bosea sp. Tri-44 TaxID=1972137 RepID=UPI00100DFB6C|nr:hypothetical protein [Bosea sp. Tri-44]RXT55822.1 hypothetical protein B6S44_06920 [Bosea sp. Tri-44]
MSHHSSELISFVLPISHRAPPTGKALRERLLLQMDEAAMLAGLARLSGRSTSSIAWLLQQDMIVPGGLLRAAIEVDRKNQIALRHERSMSITPR